MIGNWKHTIDIKNQWKSFNKSTPEKGIELIVDMLKHTKFYNEDDVYTDLVNELSKCKTVDEFDEIWNEFYDWADNHRVWIKIS